MVYAFEFGKEVSLEYSGRHFPLALLFLPCCYDMCFFSGGNDQLGRQWTKKLFVVCVGKCDPQFVFFTLVKSSSVVALL